MQIDRVRTMLDAPAEASEWLIPLGVADPRTGHANLLRLATAGLPLDLLGTICEQFAAAAPGLPDPDMALNNLERYLLSTRNLLSSAALFERDREALSELLTLFSTSQSLSDLLCTDPESYDLLRMTGGSPVARNVLVDELVAEVRKFSGEVEVMHALRRFKRRETLRIAYGDIIAGHDIGTVARQISYVADAVVEAALDFARRKLAARQAARGGAPQRLPDLVVLALGKLGGLELNYSSDIDLVFLVDGAEGVADAVETATRIATDLIRLLSETTELGFAYRVDMRLRPHGKQGPLCHTVEQALTYYDTQGRTWERQAYIKARPIAGDVELGHRFLDEIEPWIYRRYLSLADIAGIRSLRRRIEKQANAADNLASNVKTGRGGIRDIEFVIQFLQLVTGGSEPSLRTGNTLEAIERLERAGCLTHRERTILEDNYAFLRRVEHRLQMMYDLQTHSLPGGALETVKLARRLRYAGEDGKAIAAAFDREYAERTELNRRILNHLLHDSFAGDPEADPEVDLVNDPDPGAETIARVLGRYPFRDVPAAYDNLMSLANERIPFLSTRRCRLFLAAIAPRLLAAIAATPDPDGTLVTLSRVSDSLGGKAALWELFSRNHPSLNLYVTLCAACPYLVSILTSNPGMIDELMDSLLVERLPQLERLEASLAELARGAEDLDPILHSFKNAQHLRVGVRDIVGKDDVRATHAALSDIAEACLRKIADAELAKLLDKHGQPTLGSAADGDDEAAYPAEPWAPTAEDAGRPCQFLVLAMGKLGGREPNYHSDLDLVFLYEAEGRTLPNGRSRASATSNNHFFSQLAQRIMKGTNHFGPQGRLYEIDPRLRPTGKSGALALPLDAFVEYFRSGGGQLWERQALLKARVILGTGPARRRAELAVAAAIDCRPWSPDDAREIWQMRLRLQEDASPQNLKRGPGGTVDAEFLVQMLQLKHGPARPAVRVTGTLDALGALAAAGCLDSQQARTLEAEYRLMRSVEARIRLMNSAGRHEFPADEREIEKLAYLMGYPTAPALCAEVDRAKWLTRELVEQLFREAME
ncbi:MAG: bifunctional [glutamate--ammonia ligase]-adenylyl-L-tyrosine phosphorylase/[glutamate--ammonia-ligase] adenylyltransferase [Pirellulales bacterium]|nr:bifunctional [glutamate--ammonia ligase]-adenylyl-L-tyrosine phosphorylase/[glutamate--ammonia-ligase] adenylyltransferase [Pirellulales bacterium]